MALVVAAVASAGGSAAQAAGDPAAGNPAAGNPAAGKAVFQSQCAACHSLDANTQGVGPSLIGVVGRKSGAEDFYDYSPAMMSANKTWDAATLNTYLANPQAAVRGTKMAYPGLSDPTQRDNLIAYLATLK